MKAHTNLDGTYILWNNDCRDVLARMSDNAVDSIVTDPPYGLEFMGKDWDAPWKAKPSREFNDIEKGTLGGFTKLPNHSRVNNVRCEACHRWKFSSNPCACDVPQFPNARLDAMSAFQAWFTEIAAECLRVLKPGGHLLAFGGSRTYHRLACAIEDAGFEIRDQIMWVYGSGFPKSLDVSKAIDKAAGAERERETPQRRIQPSTAISATGFGANGWSPQVKEPITDAAKQWHGWGTALKPAHEPIVVARKPLEGTVAANVLKWGTGALNIDGCRVGDEGGGTQCSNRDEAGKCRGHDNAGRSTSGQTVHGPDTNTGRWPANFIHDGSDEVLALFPDTKAGTAVRRNVAGKQTSGFIGRHPDSEDVGYGDSGSAARFFAHLPIDDADARSFVYVPKAGKKERNAGLEHLASQDVHRYGAGIGEGKDPNAPTSDRNHHPTVKPIALMRYLIRLVTPPGGTVLEPFAGSGTTMAAAILEGFNVWGCELTDEYVPIILGRVAWALDQVTNHPDPPKPTKKNDDTPSLFDEEAA